MFNKIVSVLLGSAMAFGLGANVKIKNTDDDMISTKSQVSAVNTDVGQDSRTALKSNITNMNLGGYVGANIKNNVKFWQVNAYRDNRNIIEQIARAQTQTNSFDGILGTDYFNVDTYFDIDIVQRNGGNSIGWTLKSVPAGFDDRDIHFANDGEAVTDWSGAKELWIKTDASEIGAPAQIRIAFEENTAGRESYRVKGGVSATVYDNGSASLLTADSGGYLALPEGFNGYITLPLNENYFQRYFSDNGNGRLDLDRVVQFQIAVKGDGRMVGKTLYIDEFGIAGDLGGQPLPAPAESGYTYKTVWDMGALTPKSDYNSSSLPWYGEFAGKLLTGMAYSYKIYPDPALKESADEIAAELKKAQGDDGYLGVYRGGARYSISSANWDLWNQYHCITGLLEWYKVTANQTAYDVAKKTADCIYETFKDRSYLVAGGFETNRGIAHGFAQLYQVSGEEKYLAEAERIIQNDCQDLNGWYKTALNGGRFYQSSSNRWEVLHMIMTLGILYEETGNKEYYRVMSTVWEDILETDVHNGGGFTTNEGAQGNPYLDGVIETCCTVAWLAMTNEYYKYSKSPTVADEFERSYYNAMLGSLLDTDKYCTYNTPMNGIQGTCGHYDGRRVSSQQDISFQYNGGSPDMNCCQANLARGLGQLSEWAAVSEGDRLYLNYYGASKIETSADGKKVVLKQTTSYPLDGAVALEISGLEQPAEFSLLLRIPQWAYGSTVTTDGKRAVAEEGGYYEIRKVWNNGDKIQLNIELPVMFWTGEREQARYASVYRGPVLLTLDSAYAPDKWQSASFSAIDFESAEITSGSAQGCMMFADVQTKDGKVRLVDFASAGKYNGKGSPSSYRSWLTVDGRPQTDADAHTRWMNSSKIKIKFGAEIVPERTAYYAGETVRFKTLIPENYEEYEVVGEGLEIVYGDGIYSFTMPESAVELSVKFKPDEGGEGDKQPLSKGVKIALISSACVAGVAGVTACAVIIIRKRRRR